ncbi:MAG: putative DNA binding domain-containing protein [Zoogloeaceae bacterium]|jgi:ATP-dependent DNA helicase RecG|nr:putative DNA binding domain-containing protein [Zoogloeaceae bacterium]
MTNPLSLQKLDALLRSGESYTLEFKERPDKSLAAEACAFANASGGRVVIGVTDQGVVVGTDTSNAARSWAQDTLNHIEPRLQTFDDRVDITNPGGLPKGVTKENFGTISVARNGVIANLLHRAHYIEKMGAGIPHMQHATNARKVPAPTFSFDEFFRISFPRPVLAADEIVPAGAQETKEKTIGKTVESKGATTGKTREKTRDLLMDAIRANSLATTQELAQVAGISPKGVEWQLERLKKDGVITRSGPDKDGRWEVVA